MTRPKTRIEFFKHYVVSNPIAHALWRSFECERFAKEKLIHPVLDVGCGDGFFTRSVFPGKMDLGIDADSKEVRRARKSGNYKKVLTASVLQVPLPNASIRTVISNCVLEHVADIDRAFAEISRVLKPNGRLLMTVPSEHYNQDSYYQKLFRAAGFNRAAQWYNRSLNHVFKHYHVYGKKEWSKKLRRHGFKLERMDYLMSRRAFGVYDRFLLTAVFGKVLRALTGRWVLWPRPWLPGLLLPWLGGALRAEDEAGIIYFIAARKIK